MKPNISTRVFRLSFSVLLACTSVLIGPQLGGAQERAPVRTPARPSAGTPTRPPALRRPTERVPARRAPSSIRVPSIRPQEGALPNGSSDTLTNSSQLDETPIVDCSQTNPEQLLEEAHYFYSGQGNIQRTIDLLGYAESCARYAEDEPLMNQIRGFKLALGGNNTTPWPDNLYPFPDSSGSSSSPSSNTFWTDVFNAVGEIFGEANRDASTADAPTQPVAAEPPQVFNNQTQIEQTLAQWGLTSVTCSPRAVFIHELGSDVVCVEPTPEIPAGEYRYDAANHQLNAMSTPPTVNLGGD